MPESIAPGTRYKGRRASWNPLIPGRVYLEVKHGVPLWQHVLYVSAALAASLLISLAVLAANGVGARTAYEEFIVLTFFDRAGLGNILVQCSPMILAGLGAALAFRVNFWNIGIEGQFFFGAVGATIIAIYDIGPPRRAASMACSRSRSSSVRCGSPCPCSSRSTWGSAK